MHLSWKGHHVDGCQCALMIPGKALSEPGYIRGFSTGGSGMDKHQLHALAQTAYYQAQDDELAIEKITGPLEIGDEREVVSMEEGMALFRDRSGSIRALVHEGLSARKLLEAGNRFCTRWVRLDI